MADTDREIIAQLVEALRGVETLVRQCAAHKRDDDAGIGFGQCADYLLKAGKKHFRAALAAAERVVEEDRLICKGGGQWPHEHKAERVVAEGRHHDPKDLLLSLPHLCDVNATGKPCRADGTTVDIAEPREPSDEAIEGLTATLEDEQAAHAETLALWQCARAELDQLKSVEAMSRALHALDCHEANEERRREGLPTIKGWADPWLPTGIRQLEILQRRARFIFEQFAAAPLPPVDSGSALKELQDRYDSLRAWIIRCATDEKPGMTAKEWLNAILYRPDVQAFAKAQPLPPVESGQTQSECSDPVRDTIRAETEKETK
jgi:hypothetical protein